tara:strand:- start:605 stop:757 length:153 start_codon:yes stop_codon:yes gene_type:complete
MIKPLKITRLLALPDHSIEKQGLKQVPPLGVRGNNYSSRPLHQTTRIEVK